MEEVPGCLAPSDWKSASTDRLHAEQGSQVSIATEDGDTSRTSLLWRRVGRAWRGFGSSAALLRHDSVSEIEPTGSWFQGCYYIVGTIGAPFMLALPRAMADLGWAAGSAVVLASCLAMMWSATRLARLSEHGPARLRRYRALAEGVLGPRLGGKVVAGLQLLVNAGMCTIYPVVGGQSLQGIALAVCEARSDAGSKAAAQEACQRSLTPWIAGYGGAQAALVLLPDISALAAVMAMGALSTLLFSALAALGCFLAGRQPGATYELRGSSVHRVFAAFSALGSIALLFGNSMLVETQATLADAPVGVEERALGARVRKEGGEQEGATGEEAPDEAKGSSPPPSWTLLRPRPLFAPARASNSAGPMRRAVLWAYPTVLACVLLVVVPGYWAFGSEVQPALFHSIGGPAWLAVSGNVLLTLNGLAGYLVFAHSLFDAVDGRLLLSHWTGIALRRPGLLLLKRYGFRVVFVALTTLLALALPFITDLMGLVGALGYAPLCFVLPCLMWAMVVRSKAVRLPLGQTLATWAVGLGFCVVGLLAAMGALYGLVENSKTYTFFS